MKKFLIVIAILLIIGAVWYYIDQQNKATTPLTHGDPQTEVILPPAPSVTPSTGQTPIQTPAQNSSAGNAAANQTSGEDIGSNVQVWEVDYIGTGFSTTTIPISVDDYIFFENKGTGQFQPSIVGSQSYPGFGPTTPLAPKGEYRFQFSKSGIWQIGDKLNPGPMVTVVVK